MFCPPVFMCTTCVQWLWGPEEGTRWSGTDFMDVCELLCGHWELNLRPLQEQQVLSTTVPFLQTQTNIFSCKQPRIGGFYFYSTQKSKQWKLYVLIYEMLSKLIKRSRFGHLCGGQHERKEDRCPSIVFGYQNLV